MSGCLDEELPKEVGRNCAERLRGREWSGGAAGEDVEEEQYGDDHEEEMPGGGGGPPGYEAQDIEGEQTEHDGPG